MEKANTQILNLAFALVVLATVLSGWEYSVCTPVIPGEVTGSASASTCDGRIFALISKPSEIWRELVSGEINLSLLWSYTLVTAGNSALALTFATVFSVGWYWLATRFEVIRSAGYAFVWLFQVVPYIAFAWVFSIFFGAWDKAIFGFLVAVFPVIGSLLTAIRNIPLADREVMLLLGANHTTTMRHLFFPKAMAYLFGGVTLAAPLSVVGVMIADLSGGESAGLGKQVFLAVRNARPAELWVFTGAAIAVSMSFSILVWISEMVFGLTNRWYRKEAQYVGS